MKKILYVTNITRNINAFFIPHLNMLIKEGYIVDCACKITGEHEINKKQLLKDIRLYDIPVTRNPLSINNLRAFLRLIKIQKKNKYDIIHVHSPIIGAYARLLKLFFPNVKMIYTAHGFHFYKGASKITWIIFYNIEKFLSRCTDILITINNEDYNVSKNFKCKKLIKMNGVGVDFKEFNEINDDEKIKIRKLHNLEENDFVLIMVGEHNKNKNQIQLIQAIEKLEKEYPRIKVLLIGDGELIEKNKLYIEQNNIKNVRILGFRKNVNELINISDILVSLSYREGLPKNIIEGLACKKPVLGTKIRGITDLIENNRNGYTVEVENVNQTIEVIKKLYNKSKEELDQFGEYSYEKSRRYNINVILDELIKIY